MNYYVKNTKFNRKALSQVYGILSDFDDEDIEKIPLEIRCVISDNKDEDYSFSIDDVNDDNSNLLDETKEILTYLYTEFLATEEEKNVLKKLEKIQSKPNVATDNNQYEDWNFYNKNKEENEERKVVDLVEYKESLFSKIIHKIKKFFRIK